MCYVEGGMKQVALLSLLVLQVAAYHGGGSSVPQGALCQIKVAQVLVGRGQARIFFVPLMLFLERFEGKPLKR